MWFKESPGRYFMRSHPQNKENKWTGDMAQAAKFKPRKKEGRKRDREGGREEEKEKGREGRRREGKYSCSQCQQLV
jgi:hypothetical protein